MAPKLLMVDLPVCPQEGCEQTGKLPGAQYNGKAWCVGRLEKRHPRRTMEMRTFKEVRNG